MSDQLAEMLPIILPILGLGIWVAVGVWNFYAKELTRALLWVRAVATVVGIVLFAISLYLMRNAQR